MPYSVILDGGLPAPQFRTGIWPWRINVIFSSTMLSMLSLPFLLFCVSGVATGNETGINYDVFGAFFYLCRNIIYIFN